MQKTGISTHLYYLNFHIVRVLPLPLILCCLSFSMILVCTFSSICMSIDRQRSWSAFTLSCPSSPGICLSFPCLVFAISLSFSCFLTLFFEFSPECVHFLIFVQLFISHLNTCRYLLYHLSCEFVV